MKKKLLSAALALLLMLGSMALPDSYIAQSTQISASAADLYTNNKIQSRTQQQIINYINAHPFYNGSVGRYLADTYATTPVYSGGTFVQGALSTKSLTYGLNSLNVCRYVAGLGEVTLDATYNDYAQAGALCDAAIGQLTHYPTQAPGMPDDLYKKGSTNGTQKSNIGMGYSSITEAMIGGWLEDADSYNISMVGHRRWCLSPKMGKTGFGHAGSYTDMYAFDGSAGDYYGTGYTVAWPSPNMPVELFNSSWNSPVWSVSKSSSFSSNTVVTLKRLSDNKVWTLKSGTADGDFYTNNQGYGQLGCVIFRPKGISKYSAGEKFSVSIVDGSYNLSYTVNFFSLPAGTGVISGSGHTHTYGSPTWKWNGTSSATATFKCTSGDDTKTLTANVTSAVTKQPTCTAAGVRTYTGTVTFNGKKYTNTCSTTTSVAATGHTYGSPTWKWNGTSSATATFKCTKCGSTKAVNATVTNSVTKQPTCTTTGVRTYTGNVTFNGTKYTNTCSTTTTVAAKGHSWGTPSWTWGSGNKTATVKFTCSVCKTSQSPTAAVTVNASAADGKMTFTAKTTLSSKSYSTSRTGTVKRLSGNTRYTTSVEISKATYSSANTVILAYGEGFADALAGVPLAAANKAPILLTGDKSIRPEVINEIRRLGAKKVMILGGDDTISDTVKDTIENSISGITVERYQGSTRFGTAVEIAKKLNANPTEVFFVYGYKYPDALSVGSVAAAKNAPILYLKTDGDLDSATRAYLASIKKTVKNAYVIGGNDLIPDAMMKKAGDALGLTVGSTIKRISGATRYDTCVEVNKAFAGVLTGTNLSVATGTDFPDALSGGVYAAKNKAPLFLVNGRAKTLTLSAKQKSYLKSTNVFNITIFGGSDTVPNGHITVIGNGLV